MKIAFFHNLPSGGAKRVLYEEVKYLSKNHDITLYQNVNLEEDFLDFATLNCNIHNYNFFLTNDLPKPFSRFLKDFNNFFSLRSFHKKIAEEIDKEKFDVVIVHPDRFTQAPFLLRYLKTKKIYYCEEPLRIAYENYFQISETLSLMNKMYELYTRNYRKKIDRQNTQSADVILTNSSFIKEKVEHIYQRKATVCYLGVDTITFHSKNYLKKQFQLLFIGEPISVNGFDLLKEIEPLLEKKGIAIRIINFFNKTQKKKFTDKQLAREYAKSLATLCLSYEEPFGLTSLESMSSGTPVIAVNDGGYKETIIDKQTGFLINRNANDLYEKIMLLTNNPDLLKKMGQNARKHVIKNWTWEKHIKCLSSYF